MSNPKELAEKWLEDMGGAPGDIYDDFIRAFLAGYNAANEWIDATTPPKDNNWYRVKVDGKHHIQPHSYAGDVWWCYNSPIPNENAVTHYLPFND